MKTIGFRADDEVLRKIEDLKRQLKLGSNAAVIKMAILFFNPVVKCIKHS